MNTPTTDNNEQNQNSEPAPDTQNQEEKKDNQEEKKKQKSDRLEEQFAHVRELARKGETEWQEDAKHYGSDTRKILETVFGDKTRRFYDLLLGPTLVRPRLLKDPKGLKSEWKHFFIGTESEWDEKRKIAKLMFRQALDGTEYNNDNQNWLLPRNQNILLGHGSTTFHLGIVLAEKMRESLEEDNDDAFLGGTFEEAKLITYSFDFARLLAPLAVRNSAPQVYLGPFLMSPKGRDLGVNGECLCVPRHAQTNSSGAQEWLKTGKQIQTVVASCYRLGPDGSIYTRSFDEKQDLEFILSHGPSKVILLATKSKLGLKGDAGCEVPKPEKENCSFCLVTNEAPDFTTPPPRFDAVYWPGGCLFAPEQSSDND